MKQSHLGFAMITGIICLWHTEATCQDRGADAFTVQSIFETALKDGQCYHWLETLTKDVGHRLGGSENAAAAVSLTDDILKTLELDSVWLQPCRVSQWRRGEQEIATITSASAGTVKLHALELGNSVGTGAEGIAGEIVEVHSLDALNALSDGAVRGKVVFFNRPMEKGLVNTFHAYGRAVDQRSAGPRAAADRGAVAAVVRSMTTALDTFPHTGSTDYRPNGLNIPAIAISTIDAEILSDLLESEKVQMFIRTTCEMRDSVTSYNVIGEIRGSERPDEIILVGGHLDSWDVGEGAHDDGAGCVQAMDVMYLLRRIGYVPRRTIRCVLFMNEENGLAGGKTYARESNAANEFHLAAIESDMGGFLPLGFGMSAEGTLQEQYYRGNQEWWGILEPYGLGLSPGGGGADISSLKSQGGMLFGMRTNAQRYFDYHHTAEDTFDKVHRRELRLGAAAMTALVFLLDKYAERQHE
jgi:hypothetical protein